EPTHSKHKRTLAPTELTGFVQLRFHFLPVGQNETLVIVGILYSSKVSNGAFATSFKKSLLK
ncbi:MAG: hypothetical protein ABI091_25605, partial [Ferruginibacter sp.]